MRRRSHLDHALALALAVLGASAGPWLATAAEGQGARAPRSRIVYPPETIGIRMDHAHPAHRELRCVRCHEAAPSSADARDSLAPPERACRPCHDAALDRARQGADTCGTCHVGFEAPGDPVAVSVSPPARLRFSHRAHAREGVRCVTCHAGLSRAGVATRAHLPTMETCLDCHGQTSAGPSGACATCHETEPDGVLRVRFPEGVMNPPRVTGMHHDRDFLVRHRWVAADRGADCASCHRERECIDCHDGRVRPERVHPNDFLTLHPVQARRDAPRCTSCHTVQTFCGECHARLGLAPVSAPVARAGARFHPPAEVWSRGPVRHAREARRSMTACASCHVEQDCVQCHGVLGIGAGLSPHPPGFTSRSGEALARNPRACRVCHGADARFDACR